MMDLNRRDVLKISGTSLATVTGLSASSTAKKVPVGRIIGTRENPVTRAQMNRLKTRLFQIAREQNNLDKSGFADAYPGVVGDGRIVDYVAMFDSEGRLKHHAEAVGVQTPAEHVRSLARDKEQEYRQLAANNRS